MQQFSLALESPLNFKAYERPMDIRLADGRYINSGMKAIVRANPNNLKDPVVIGEVGNTYKLVQNEDIFRTVHDEIGRSLPEKMLSNVRINDEISDGGSFCSREYVFLDMKYEVDHGYAKHYGDMRRSPLSATNVGFRLKVSHSFDGSSSLRMLSGAIDFYCTNRVVHGEFDQYMQRHTSGLALPNMAKRLEASIQIFWTQAAKFRAWAKKEITNEEAKQLFIELNISERRLENMMLVWMRESAQRGATIWALFSVMTYFASHNSAEFPIRKAETQARLMHNREMQVVDWIESEPFKKLAVIEA